MSPLLKLASAVSVLRRFEAGELERFRRLSSVWLETAVDEMYPAVMNWIHSPSGSAKRAIFEAYDSLEPKARQAYDADVASAFHREHGSKVIAYRYRERSGPMGGTSVSPVEPTYLDPSKYAAYEVVDKDVLVHYAQKDMPLGGKAFGHEKEMILRPEANPRKV